MNDIELVVAVARIEESVRRIESRVKSIEDKVSLFERDRYRAAGGLAVLAVFGSVLGFIFSQFIDVASIFSGALR